MTDKPKTLSLAPREWNALLASNTEDLAALFKSQPMPNVELYKNIVDHLERMRMILPGWLASAPKPTPVEPVAQAAPLANGAAPPKRRGRRTNAEKAAMAARAQVQ